MMRIPVDWVQRTAQAEAFAREVIATANERYQNDPHLDRDYPQEFAELIHVWSLAHPLPPPVGGVVDFAQVQDASGASRYTLDRLTDGRVMCQLCFSHVYPEDLNPVDGPPGSVEDVCRRCALTDRETAHGGG